MEARPRAVGRRKLERFFLLGCPADTDELGEPGALLARGETGRRQGQVPGQQGQPCQRPRAGGWQSALVLRRAEGSQCSPRVLLSGKLLTLR